MNRTVGWLKEQLLQFPDEATWYPYEGEEEPGLVIQGLALLHCDVKDDPGVVLYEKQEEREMAWYHCPACGTLCVTRVGVPVHGYTCQKMGQRVTREQVEDAVQEEQGKVHHLSRGQGGIR